MTRGPLLIPSWIRSATRRRGSRSQRTGPARPDRELNFPLIARPSAAFREVSAPRITSPTGLPQRLISPVGSGAQHCGDFRQRSTSRHEYLPGGQSRLQVRIQPAGRPRVQLFLSAGREPRSGCSIILSAIIFTTNASRRRAEAILRSAATRSSSSRRDGRNYSAARPASIFTR